MSTVTMTASREVNPVCGVKHCVLTEPHATEDDEHVAFEVRRDAADLCYSVRVWKYVVPDPRQPDRSDWEISVHVPQFAGAPRDADQLMMAVFAARAACEDANRGQGSAR
jgi:hypothetical protein